MLTSLENLLILQDGVTSLNLFSDQLVKLLEAIRSHKPILDEEMAKLLLVYYSVMPASSSFFSCSYPDVFNTDDTFFQKYTFIISPKGKRSNTTHCISV